MTTRYPLDILVCPETHARLREASSEELDSLQQAFAAESLQYVTGSSVSEPFSGALIREDGAVAYCIRNDIPVLLMDEAISLKK